MEKAVIKKINFKPSTGEPRLEQGIKSGMCPRNKIIFGGSNGSYRTGDPENASDIIAIVQIEGGEPLEISIKYQIREAADWERLSSKRVKLITENFPQNIEVYQDTSNGYWYISDKDLENWGKELRSLSCSP